MAKSKETNMDYAAYRFEEEIKKALAGKMGEGFDETKFRISPVPKQFSGTADYGAQVAELAKSLGLTPPQLTNQLAEYLNTDGIFGLAEAKGVGPYLNLKLEMSSFGEKVVEQILSRKADYGKENIGHGKQVVIDMSAPNIAKRMGIGHLRSTIIGDALASIYRSEGFEVIRDNHIGDWGTQFGKLIVAIKRYGNEEQLVKSPDPIGELQELYVDFHSKSEAQANAMREEAKKKVQEEGLESYPELAEAVHEVSQEIVNRKKIEEKDLDMEKVIEDALDRVIVSPLDTEAREWFKKLEEGDPEARRLWKLCVDLSIKEFNEMYQILGVEFEETLGESYYESMLKEVVKEVREKGVAKESKGALVIDMEDKNLGVGMVQKSDGASLYLTRDLACAIFRESRGADMAIYVVGEDQKLYFQQLFEALRRLGHPIGSKAKHIYFGMVKLPEGKMSTRHGRVVLLKDVIEEGLNKSRKIIEEKNPDMAKDPKQLEKVARQVAIGALKWNDLSQDKRRTITFTWEAALNFDGFAGPYVQYTAVRANSILTKSAKLEKPASKENKELPKGAYTTDGERSLIRALAEYPRAVKTALQDDNPAKIAEHVYEVAKWFNTFYKEVPVLGAETRELREARLKLVAASSQVITNGLGLLGIEVPERM